MNKLYAIAVIAPLCLVSLLGCKHKNSADVCDKTVTDSFRIRNHAFAIERDSTIQICGVQWRLNHCPPDLFVLITSVQPEAPEMATVIKFLDSIYGEHEEVEPSHFCWQGITLRTFRTDEGGTCILIHNRELPIVK